MGALAVCPFELMDEKYMCMVVWECGDDGVYCGEDWEQLFRE